MFLSISQERGGSFCVFAQKLPCLPEQKCYNVFMNGKEILQAAQKNQYALGSFNFSTAEILKAIVTVGKKFEAPLIVSTSEGEGDFFGMKAASAMVDFYKKETGLDIILNLDHGKSLEKVKEAIEAGYTAIHFDGSQYDFVENIKKTKEIVDYVKSVNENIVVEGELGYLRGSSALHDETLEIFKDDLTDPGQAQKFVESTGIDSLAMVIGNAHGVYTNSPEKLYLDRLQEIKEAVGPEAFLVLHGGSGVPPEDVRAAIKLGVVKVNINTDMRLAWRRGLEDGLRANPDSCTPYKILKSSLEGVQAVVEEKIKIFYNK
ncbi:MAG: tagatose-bisphosphate aldolase [Candidatus Portnoybacteria bacterium CG10_big_fil_rev_8_21_14_0_10_44_7]|uniref:Tagatose-bisphosphate aldolase n=1 Tax=Candidatus Portnoybacteria bacterium CG10_big_fil_rev_8_21_14_0_10_44_7 TaxID=1974816 RepID=A0A2M8KIB8_9BACT|nr:MAG: tagatose-bisphosphate aldolase [Candidatus Portnoybacteria bacterium CG10_big_fil_rev_8_21_14_0_10_44_7]